MVNQLSNNPAQGVNIIQFRKWRNIPFPLVSPVFSCFFLWEQPSWQPWLQSLQESRGSEKLDKQFALTRFMLKLFPKSYMFRSSCEKKSYTYQFSLSSRLTRWQHILRLWRQRAFLLNWIATYHGRVLLFRPPQMTFTFCPGLIGDGSIIADLKTSEY